MCILVITVTPGQVSFKSNHVTSLTNPTTYLCTWMSLCMSPLNLFALAGWLALLVMMMMIMRCCTPNSRTQIEYLYTVWSIGLIHLLPHFTQPTQHIVHVYTETVMNCPCNQPTTHPPTHTATTTC